MGEADDAVAEAYCRGSTVEEVEAGIPERVAWAVCEESSGGTAAMGSADVFEAFGARHA